MRHSLLLPGLGDKPCGDWALRGVCIPYPSTQTLATEDGPTRSSDRASVQLLPLFTQHSTWGLKIDPPPPTKAGICPHYWGVLSTSPSSTISPSSPIPRQSM